MKREQSRDPRRLPNPEELRKTTEPLSQSLENASLEDVAISRKSVNSANRHSNHRP